MLSKYYWFKKAREYGWEADEANSSAMLAKLNESLNSNDVKSISPGGTLGIFFEAHINGNNKFIKTHRNGIMYEENLIKEFQLLRYLNGDFMHVDTFSLNCSGIPKTFLIMDWLDLKKNEYDVAYIRKLIEEYQKNLNGAVIKHMNYDLTDICKAAYESFALLEDKKLISYEISLQCEKSLKRFEHYANNCDRVICHGDCSNVNIVSKQHKTFLLDWEDALIGFRNYDLLYWLTFFGQRKYYSPNLLHELNIPEQSGRDTMAVILLVKSAISYMNETYKCNNLSMDERIGEVLQL